jgi:Fanconi anemia group M protein
LKSGEIKLEPTVVAKPVEPEQRKEEPEKTQTQLKVIVDYREKPSGILTLFHEMNIAADVQTLEFGDYVISKSVIVERKEASDFISSIKDGRLFQQVRGLKDLYELPVVLIEGSIFDSGIKYRSLLGIITSLVVDWRVGLLFSHDIGESAEYIRSLCYREQVERTKGIIVHRGKKPEQMYESQRFIVAGYPLISGELSHRILLHFKSIQKFVNATVDELMKIEGLGKKKANRIHEVNTAQYRPKEKS